MSEAAFALIFSIGSAWAIAHFFNGDTLDIFMLALLFLINYRLDALKHLVKDGSPSKQNQNFPSGDNSGA
jgi:hypothetical protein